MRIIIADDDAVSLLRLSQVLTALGHEPEAHPNGLAAWESFQKLPARIVISDWEMPEMNGMDLCREIRARASEEYTYFVLASAANTDESAYDQAIEGEVDDFLVKPLRRDAIYRRLRVAQRILRFAHEIQQLQSLLPICMYCKKIRDDQDYWQEVESYFHSSTGANFSHGICPECFAKWKAEHSRQKAH